MRENVSKTAPRDDSGSGQTRTCVEPDEKANFPTPGKSIQCECLQEKALAKPLPQSSTQPPTSLHDVNAGAAPCAKANVNIQR
jgi:hypothetical protein